MVDRELLRRRIDLLFRYLDLARPLGEIPQEEFLREPRHHHLAERYLHLAAEAALDIAHHLIADAGWEAPETNRGAFVILESHGLIDSELSAGLQSWAGFRNILVHDYADIDHALCRKAIQDDLGELVRFAAIAAEKL